LTTKKRPGTAWHELRVWCRVAGSSRHGRATDAFARVQALALRVLADRLERREAVPELLNVTFQAA